MKNWVHSITLILSFSGVHVASAFGPLMNIFDTKWEFGRSFAKTVDDTIEDLKKRQEITEKLYGSYKASLEHCQKMTASLKEQMNRLSGVELHYSSQKLVILTKMGQVLNEIVQVYAETGELLKEHIKVLEEYKHDPEFKEKGLRFEEKSIYSIEDFQKISTKILQLDAELKNLEGRRDKIIQDCPMLKKNLELAQQSLVDKKQEQAELKEQSPAASWERKKFTLKQQGALLDLEERLITYKRDLVEARLKDADSRALFVELQIKITKSQLDILRRQETYVRQELRIDKKDVETAERKLQQKIQESGRLQEDYGRRIESLGLVRQKELDQITLIREKGAVSDQALEQIYEWNYKPVTVEDWRLLIEIGRLHSHITYEIDVLKEILLAKIEQEKAAVASQEADTLIIHSWEHLTNGSFDGMSDALAKEIKNYEKMLADIENSTTALADKRSSASRLLANNGHVAETIQARIKELKSQRETVFSSNGQQYSLFGEALTTEATTDTHKRNELITQLIELYLAIGQQRSTTSKKIETILNVLQTKARSKLVPPLWIGLKKFIPDVGRFITYFSDRSHFQRNLAVEQGTFLTWLGRILSSPLSFIMHLLYLVLIILLFFLLRLYVYDMGLLLTVTARPEYGFISLFISFIALAIQFIGQQVTTIYLWSLLLLLVGSGAVGSYFSALFYVLSIPVWLYYVRTFITYAKSINLSRDYLFASKKYHERFFFVLRLLLSSTVIILFFREAFLRVLPQSDVPHILGAVNYIILQISLILMISREQILRLIPRYTALGEWIQELVDDYYYFFLAAIIFIIVMSNPYIGFGTQFLHIIGRVILIMILIPLVVMVHNGIKAFFSTFFFYADEEGRLNDRFSYARSSYGLFIIVSFFFFSIFALILAANIWGFKVGLSEIFSWLRKERYSYTSSETGLSVPVNIIHIIRVVLYVIGGVALAFLANRFFLRRMFDLLLIDVGVQNIFLSLTRYIVLLVALIIGLQSIGLGGTSMLYIFAVIGGLGVAGKEIIADFIGYFMILIQRPLKVGDYVQVEPDLFGVVRRLTLRSVVLRKKNSVTIIVPNSYLLSKPLTNWNYYRMYFAFDDIVLTVSYDADPEKVRELLLKILDENYEVLRSPAPIVQLRDFNENGFEFMVRGFLSHDKVLDQNDITSAIRLKIVSVLRKQGYDIGFSVQLYRIVKDEKKS